MNLRTEVGNEEAVVLALMLYSDETELSATGKKTVWPIMMSLANIPQEIREKRGGFKLLGMFPNIKETTTSATQNAKLFKLCLDELLSPLKQLSHDGFEHSGVMLYPLLYAYIHDYPEGGKVKNFSKNFIIGCLHTATNYVFCYFKS